MKTSATLDTKKQVAPAFVPARSAIRSEAGLWPTHAPARASVSETSFAHDFSGLATHSADAASDTRSTMQACPLALNTPRACPFGGACHTCPARIQTKLVINKPGDEYEQEADRVAEHVMRMPDPIASKPPEASVQRKCATCEDEEEPLQRKLTHPSSSMLHPSEVPPLVHEVAQSPGQPLDVETRAFMEPRFGHDFSRVRVHTDETAARSARTVNARAYTAGSDVVFEQGQYAPHANEGRRLIAHELAHVVQQYTGPRAIQRREKEKTPCALHAYDSSNPKDTAVIPKSGGIGVNSVADLVSKVNGYVSDPANSCSCINRLEINAHGTDGYQSVGNGTQYKNDDKALVHDSTEEHLKQMASIKFCSMGLLMLLGCHVGQGKGKTLLSRLSAILPGKLIGGAQHYTSGTGLGEKRVVRYDDVRDKDGNLDWDKADPFLTSPFVRWHITIAEKEYVINGTEATSSEGKAKLKVAEKVKVKTPEGEVKIK